MTRPFDDMTVDHVEFYVSDLPSKAAWWLNSYGFAVSAASDEEAPVRSMVLSHNQVDLVLTESADADHAAAEYVKKHGDGVANIGLGVADASAAFDEAVRRGARPVSEPATVDGVTTASIIGFGDVAHTFIQRHAGAPRRALPGMRPTATPTGDATVQLGAVDHFAVCVEPGDLDRSIEFYRRVLDFDLIFEERVAVGKQAMTTRVVESTSGAVTLTLIEPDVSCEPGHIDSFLRDHGGAGVQHMAFATGNIVSTLDSLAARGVAFLDAPGSYYSMLAGRVEPIRYAIGDLRERNILVDEDHGGQLYQIFTMSTHPRNTIFFELIERLGATSFGSGNIKALYEAVELQRHLERSE
ncbi:4-hydroxyphenylpyruvate dioxygenase [Saccharothrix yanglingensis]|nr:4-hydroxyphenylpyruvate dioxygenase [Saccharothrix yanglingensis]